MARPEYEPMSLNDFKNYMDMAYRTQLAWAPQDCATCSVRKAAAFAGHGQSVDAVL